MTGPKECDQKKTFDVRVLSTRIKRFRSGRSAVDAEIEGVEELLEALMEMADESGKVRITVEERSERRGQIPAVVPEVAVGS